MPLKSIPIGTVIHNIELKAGKELSLSDLQEILRTNGQGRNYAQVRLPSEK